MEEVSKLLDGWGMRQEIIDKFQDADIDLFALEHINDLTIQRLIKTAGQQIRFTTQRQKWLEACKATSKSNQLQLEHQSLISSANCEEGRTAVIAVMDLNGNSMNVCTNNLQIPEILMEDDEIRLIDVHANVADLTAGASGSGCTGIKKSDASNALTVKPSIRNTAAKSYDLNALLKQSDNGRCVRAKYGLDEDEELEEASGDRNERYLDDHHKNLLATAIIEEELRGDASTLLSWERMSFLGDAIKALFPTETKNTYVNRSVVNGKTLLKGKLYFKYYNKRRAYRKSGLIESPQTTKKKKITSGSCVIDPEIEGDILWLTQNASPWKDVLELWKKTAKARFVNLKKDSDKPLYEYTSMFPALQEPEGFRLLEVDFLSNEITKDKKMCLFQVWPRLSSFVIKIVREKELDFLEDGAYTQTETIVQVLMNIASLFKTITISRGKRSKGKKQWRPTAVECQEAFLLHIETISLLHEKMEERRQKMAKQGLHLQPQAVVVGPLECPTQCLVVIDNFHYEVKSVLRAIDITFKCFHALYTPYPPEAEQIWLFLQRAVYKFSTEHHDKSFTNVETRLAEFEQHNPYTS